jgi:hypothetical protein|nr:MAG TPA: hypothetical protein [Bacteriophage sp.]
MTCIPYINDLVLEIDTLRKLNCSDDIIKQKEKQLEECKINLSKLSGNSIEYRIYLKILYGKNPTQAVEEVADENFMKDIKPNSYPQIWRIYKKIKKML